MKCDLEEFHLADMVFISAPIDYLIIDGYNEFKDGNRDRELRIVLADIKTGQADLSTE
jgi:predicted Holliday junction resolvase-like endonuclease